MVSALWFVALLSGSVAALPFNSTFQKWHPTYHFQAPYGWMNDPCGPGFDPRTGLYHLSYQWNPASAEWGNISWGHAVSTDLISWRYNKRPQLVPLAPYDNQGVFTGSLIESGLRGRPDALTIVYTAVSHLPISYTLNYTVGAEKLAIATSKDGGKTWRRTVGNPIVSGPPPGLNVTGWRDPFVAAQPTFDAALSHPEDTSLYGIVSGGIQGVRPTSFLYRMPKDDLADWSYVGEAVDLSQWKPSRWQVDVGKNWEVANLFELDGTTIFFAGAEGVVLNRTGVVGRGPQRTPRLPVWYAGDVKAEGGAVSLVPVLGGALDHGPAYASNSFWDSKNGRRIVWSWLQEEDITAARRAAQGWAGAMSLPRHLFVATVTNVVGLASASALDALVPAFALTTHDDKSYNVSTLGVAPAPEVIRLRRGPAVYAPRSKTLQAGQAATLEGISSMALELSASVRIDEDVDEVGFIVRQSSDSSEQTVISLRPDEGLVVIDRSRSTTLQDINVDADSGPFELFSLCPRCPAGDDAEELEAWNVRIFVDNSVVEVYANDRFVLSSRIYPDRPDSLGASVYVSGGQAVFNDLSAWHLSA